jgi:hypothetical protein
MGTDPLFLGLLHYANPEFYPNLGHEEANPSNGALHQVPS